MNGDIMDGEKAAAEARGLNPSGSFPGEYIWDLVTGRATILDPDHNTFTVDERGVLAVDLAGALGLKPGQTIIPFSKPMDPWVELGDRPPRDVIRAVWETHRGDHAMSSVVLPMIIDPRPPIMLALRSAPLAGEQASAALLLHRSSAQALAALAALQATLADPPPISRDWALAGALAMTAGHYHAHSGALHASSACALQHGGVVAAGAPVGICHDAVTRARTVVGASRRLWVDARRQPRPRPPVAAVFGATAKLSPTARARQSASTGDQDSPDGTRPFTTSGLLTATATFAGAGETLSSGATRMGALATSAEPVLVPAMVLPRGSTGEEPTVTISACVDTVERWTGADARVAVLKAVDDFVSFRQRRAETGVTFDTTDARPQEAMETESRLAANILAARASEQAALQQRQRLAAALAGAPALPRGLSPSASAGSFALSGPPSPSASMRGSSTSTLAAINAARQAVADAQEAQHVRDEAREELQRVFASRGRFAAVGTMDSVSAAVVHLASDDGSSVELPAVGTAVHAEVLADAPSVAHVLNAVAQQPEPATDLPATTLTATMMPPDVAAHPSEGDLAVDFDSTAPPADDLILPGKDKTLVIPAAERQATALARERRALSRHLAHKTEAARRGIDDGGAVNAEVGAGHLHDSLPMPDGFLYDTSSHSDDEEQAAAYSSSEERPQLAPRSDALTEGGHEHGYHTDTHVLAGAAAGTVDAGYEAHGRPPSAGASFAASSHPASIATSGYREPVVPSDMPGPAAIQTGVTVPAMATRTWPVNTSVLHDSTQSAVLALTSDLSVGAGASFELVPSRIDFGEVPAGNLVTATLTIFNRSSGLLRFKAGRGEMSHTAVGNSVRMAHEMGPLVKHLSRPITIELLARERGHIATVLHIITAAGTAEIPVTASVV